MSKNPKLTGKLKEVISPVNDDIHHVYIAEHYYNEEQKEVFKEYLALKHELDEKTQELKTLIYEQLQPNLPIGFDIDFDKITLGVKYAEYQCKINGMTTVNNKDENQPCAYKSLLAHPDFKTIYESEDITPYERRKMLGISETPLVKVNGN